MHQRRRAFILSAAISSVVLSTQVLAAESGSFTLEEMLVTAQKREQAIQDVPISVSVVGGDKILEQGYGRLADLSAFTPNFTVNESATGNQATIRGFGTSTLNSTAFEQSVGTFVDGVYMGRETQSFASLMDIERVEVLRGPQTTFFGQSAIAGALNIQTRKPNMEEAEGYIKAGYGEDGDVRFQGAYGGPLTETLGARIAGSWRDFDGWGTNGANGEDSMGQESWTGRGTLLWAPSEKLEVKFKYEKGELDRTPGAAQISTCGTAVENACRIQDAAIPGGDDFSGTDDVASTGGTVSAGGQSVLFLGSTTIGPFHAPITGVDLTPLWGTNLNYKDWGVLDGVSRIEQDSQTLEVNYDVNDYLLTYTGAKSFAKNSAHGSGDLDFTAVFLHQQAGGVNYETESHEFRITSPDSESLEWMAGIYWQQGTTDYAFGQLQGWAVGPPTTLGRGADRVFEEEQTYLSGFAAATFKATEALDLDVGIRYMDVEKDAESCQHALSIDPAQIGNPISVAVPGCTVLGTNWNVGDYNDSNSDYSLSARYAVNDDVNMYVKYTDGYKAGGFNSLWVGDPSLFGFDPEEVEAYELGMKGTFMEGRLNLNLALFQMNYTNLQVTSRIDTDTGSLFPIVNAAEATSEGIEVDAQWMVSESLMLGVSAALLDASYDSFTSSACGNLEALVGYKGCTSGASVDRSGETLPFSPDWSTSLFLSYKTPIMGDLELRLNADVTLADCYYCDYTLSYSGDGSYDNMNLRAAIGSENNVWEVSVYGRNVTDNQPLSQPNTVLYGDSSTLFRQSVVRGANYGVELLYNF